MSLKLLQSKQKRKYKFRRRNLILLLTHGILHLLGYDHDEEKAEAEMKEMEKTLLTRHAEHLRSKND